MKNINVTLLGMNLRLFDNTNITGDAGMSAEMKTYYSDYLIDYAKPLLIHDQFGQKHPVPRNGGKKIEFRKKSPFAKALTPLTEGVTPAGQKLEWSILEATVSQYGAYVELSDRLIVEAIDNNIVYATENCGDQSGRTLDTVTREILNGGTNVQYGDAVVNARYKLVGGSATPANNHYLTVNTVKRAARALKVGGAKPINGDYVAVIHPDVAYDLTGDTNWIDVKKYSDPSDIYEGEIGKLYGVRFVETLEAKIFSANGLTAAARNLTVKTTLGAPGKVVAVDEAITAGEATALAGRKIILGTAQYTLASAAAGAAGSATITTTEDVSIANGTKGNIAYPGEAGAAGRDVYSTLFLGADAYGITEIEGEGLQHFVKQLGSSGSADPLNQRATVGWKASKVAERLVESFMLRVETASTYESGAN